MEWNAKSPLQWDWENLIMFNAKASEYPKKLKSSDWVIDGEGSIDFGSFYSSTGVGACGGSGSDVGHASSSKSSKSASFNSSSIVEMKTSKFILEAFQDIPEDFSNRKDYAMTHPTSSSHAFEASAGSGEPLLGLKLGKRTYFEDVCVGSNSKIPSLSTIPVSPDALIKKSKSNCMSVNAQRCQVEGCNLDLSSSKDYHRKHRVCESHSKCPKVIVSGQERRFCQQCSRFHGLSEFDEKKRSCRRRLSDHNARRRKPQPEAVQLNQGRLSSSFDDMRHQMNLVLNRTPMAHARAAANLAWENTCRSTFTLTKGGYPFKPTKAGVIDGQLHYASNELSVPINRVFHDSNRLLPTKAITAEVLQGFEESEISSNLEATQDLHRALSLLSTNSWPSCEPKATSLDRPIYASHNATMSQPSTLAATRGMECWHIAQDSNKSEVHALTSPNDGTNHFQEFQLLRAPYDNGFYANELN